MDSPDYYYHPSADEEITYEPSRWSTEQPTIIKTAHRTGLSMRRHGIPDSDKRPFEIAYQQAILARRDRERAIAEASRSGEPLPSSRPSSVQPMAYQSQSQNQYDHRRYGEERSVSASVRSRHHSTQSSQMIRTDSYSSLQPSSQPQAGNNVFRDTGSFAKVHVHRPSTPLSRTNSEDWAARYAPAPPAPAPEPRRKRPMATSQRPNENGRVIPTIITTAPTPVARRSRKRLNLEEDDRENRPNGKRSRIEGRERIDGDEDATWVKALPVVTRTSIKRSASPGADSDSRSKRGKKLRPVEAKPMDLDSVTSSSTESRGRKRPRHSDVAEDDRHSDSQRGSDRNKKGRRVPDLVETPSTQEDETLVSESDGQEIDVNIAESGPTTLDDDDYDVDGTYSTDPLCGGRKIGEEWQSGERKYKVGPDGSRLIKVAVRQARRRYNMPKDSEHPDATLKMDVIVDQWVTEPEYLNLKKLGQLGWQDAPAAPTPTDAGNTIRYEGKPLIWGGPTNRLARTRTASRLTPLGTPTGSPATSLARLPSDAFASPIHANSRRVASPGAPMWMMIPGHRRKNGIYSDWEKQDLEAESILKMRQKLRANQAAQSGADATPNPLPITSSLFAPVIASVPAIVPAVAAAPTDEKKTVRFAETPAASDKPSTPSPFSWPSATSTTTAATAPTLATLEVPKPAFSFNAPTTTPAAPMNNFFNAQAPTANANSMTTETTPATTAPAIPNFFANTAATTKPTEVKPPMSSMFDFSKPVPSATPATTPGFSFNTVNAGSTPAVTDNNKPFSFGPSTTPATAPTSTNPFFNTASSTPSNAMETSATSQTPAASLPTTANNFFPPAAASAQLPEQPKIPNFFSNPAQPQVATSTPASQPFSFSTTPAATSTPPTTAPNSLLSRLGTNEAKPPSVFSWPQTSATSGATDPTKPAVARPTASSFFSPLPAPTELPKPAATTKSPFFNGIDTAALGIGKPSVPTTPMATESKPAFTFGNTSTTPATKGASFAFGTPSSLPVASTTVSTTPAGAPKPAWGGPKFVFNSTPGAPETAVPASSSPAAFQFNAGAAAGFPVKASASTTPAAPSTTNGFQFNAGAAAGFPVKPAATTPIFPANAAVPKFSMGAKPPPAAPTSTRYSSRPRSGFNSSAPPPPPANLNSPAPSALTPSAVPSASSTPANPFGAFGGVANGAMNGAASPFAFGAAANPGAFQFGAASPNPAQAAAAGGGSSFFGAK